MTSYRDLAYALDILTFRNIAYIFLVTILGIVWYRGNIIWCICLALLCTISYFVLRQIYGDKGLLVETAINVEDLIHVEDLETRFKIILQKWRALDSPQYMKMDLDLINFFYAIKVWKFYNEDSFRNCITLVEDFLQLYKTETGDNRNGLTRLRQQINTAFESFKALSGYTQAMSQLDTILAKYIS